ncbi:MAG: rhodanese-related sulfurtransferase [Pyrinomonadaceae bacterium]
MSGKDKFQIITFYEFKDMASVGELTALRESLRQLMQRSSVRGTIILSNEGFNSTLGGTPENIAEFLIAAGKILVTQIVYRTSYHDHLPFRFIKVRIKPEIVTLKRPFDVSLGTGTHVKAKEWNSIINDPETIVLDTRNHYEFRTGTFRNAINPNTEKFNDLPAFVEESLDPRRHKKVAMFCTGGIRCEKFAPYMKGLGFEEIYQLEGGILKYLEDVDPAESLWQGECFVFDERISVDAGLQKGSLTDFSQTQEK